MTAREAEIIELIHKEVKPALGCTEPIAVALAVAKAMEILEDKCSMNPDWRMNSDYRLDIKVSGNILKNGMGVGIPGTGMVGLFIAAALGAVCGKSSYGLEVLQDFDEVSINKAAELKLVVGETINGKNYFKPKDPVSLTQTCQLAYKLLLETGKAKAVRFSTLSAICRELDCQPGDILEYIEGEQED